MFPPRMIVQFWKVAPPTLAQTLSASAFISSAASFPLFLIFILDSELNSLLLSNDRFDYQFRREGQPCRVQC